LAFRLYSVLSSQLAQGGCPQQQNYDQRHGHEASRNPALLEAVRAGFSLGHWFIKGIFDFAHLRRGDLIKGEHADANMG